MIMDAPFFYGQETESYKRERKSPAFGLSVSYTNQKFRRKILLGGGHDKRLRWILRRYPVNSLGPGGWTFLERCSGRMPGPPSPNSASADVGVGEPR